MTWTVGPVATSHRPFLQSLPAASRAFRAVAHGPKMIRTRVAVRIPLPVIHRRSDLLRVYRHRTTARSRTAAGQAGRSIAHRRMSARGPCQTFTRASTAGGQGSGSARSTCASYVFCCGLGRGAGPAERRSDSPSSFDAASPSSCADVVVHVMATASDPCVFRWRWITAKASGEPARDNPPRPLVLAKSIEVSHALGEHAGNLASVRKDQLAVRLTRAIRLSPVSLRSL